MIKKPYELIKTEKKLKILLAGYPGIGKTTLALSSPKPLLIDVDKGLDRVKEQHKTDFIQPENYSELIKDLTPENLKDYESLVIDTGGQLLNLMKEHVKKDNPKNGQSDGSLSLKGYGAINRLFDDFVNKIFTFNLLTFRSKSIII